MSALKPVQVNVPEKLVMTADEYHAHEAFGSSDLKQVLRSPAHFKHYRENPSEPTPAMAFGTVAHAAILEPNFYLANHAVMPKFEGKGCRERKDQWLMENHGRFTLTAEQDETIKAMLKAIAGHKTARALFSGGVSEESYFWRDAATGLLCKARPDYLKGGSQIIDLKTTSDASFSAFQRTICSLKYHLSAAHYVAGVSEVMSQTFNAFTIVAVETSAPYGVQVFDLDEATLEKGLELRNRALETLQSCKQTGRYPAYPDYVVEMNLPPWGWTE